MSMDEEKLKEKRTAKLIAKLKAKLPWVVAVRESRVNNPEMVADKLRKTSKEATRLGIDTKQLILEDLDREISILYELQTPVFPFWMSCILLVWGLYVIRPFPLPFILGIMGLVTNLVRFSIIMDHLPYYQLLKRPYKLLCDSSGAVEVCLSGQNRR